jgi:hypothetical protein
MGLWNLIVALIIGGLVYWLSTLPKIPLVAQVGMVVGALIAIIGLLVFLKPFLVSLGL